jgi:hypothetical protein
MAEDFKEETDILKELGLDSISEEKKAEILNLLAQTLHAALVNRIDQELSPEDKQNLLQLIEKGNEDEINNFIGSKIQNFDQIYAEELAKFKNEMKNQVHDIRAIVNQALKELKAK